MIWLWVICGIVVLMALSAVWQIFARLFFAFSLAAGILLAFYFRDNPGEAGVALAGLGGVVLLRRPVVRLLTGLL